MTTERYAYYPGCSLHSSAREYDLSARAVCAALGVDLLELDGWSCCGASFAHDEGELLALALPARNLALAQDVGLDLAVPCAACFNRTAAADHALRESPERRARLEDVLGFAFAGTSRPRPLLDLVARALGRAGEAAVRRRLDGLRLAAYYGCLLVRPGRVVQFDEPEHPASLDALIAALGGEPVEWGEATECCGGGLAMSRGDAVGRLVARILDRAVEAGAQALVTACPLCQLNLETRQGRRRPVPILYFTELVGLALGLPDAPSWLRRHVVDPGSLTGLLPLPSTSRGPGSAASVRPPRGDADEIRS